MLALRLIIDIRAIYLNGNLGTNYSYQDVEDTNYDTIVGFGSTLLFLIYVVTIIFFLRWFRRAYQNVRALGVELRYSKNMSVGAWFIPFFHWLGPIQMMLEIYRNTERILAENSIVRKKKGMYIVIAIWWIFYILCGLDGISFSFIHPSIISSEESGKILANHIILSSGLNLVLSIMVLPVVNNYRVLENKLSQLSNVSESKIISTDELIDDELING
jgi:heme/copper-type cytochrome/quinol oxidase subunit 2